jgi:hypothetical protein
MKAGDLSSAHSVDTVLLVLSMVPPPFKRTAFGPTVKEAGLDVKHA